MQFNAKDDFVSQIEAQEETELELEAKKSTEEDLGFDDHYNIPDLSDLEEIPVDHNEVDENFGDDDEEEQEDEL